MAVHLTQECNLWRRKQGMLLNCRITLSHTELLEEPGWSRI